MPRLSISILHFIWDYQRRGIKQFTSPLPQGQDSQLPANQPAVGKMLQVELEVLFLTHAFSLLQNPSFSTAWIWFANYSFPSVQKKLGMGWKIMDRPENLLNLCEDLEGKLTICCMLEQLRLRTLVPLCDLNSTGSRNVFINTNFVFRESDTTIVILNPCSMLCTTQQFLINTNMVHKLIQDLEICAESHIRGWVSCHGAFQASPSDGDLPYTIRGVCTLFSCSSKRTRMFLSKTRTENRIGISRVQHSIVYTNYHPQQNQVGK